MFFIAHKYVVKLSVFWLLDASNPSGEHPISNGACIFLKMCYGWGWFFVQQQKEKSMTEQVDSRQIEGQEEVLVCNVAKNGNLVGRERNTFELRRTARFATEGQVLHQHNSGEREEE